MSLNTLFQIGDHVEFIKTEGVLYTGNFPLKDTSNYLGKDFIIDDVKTIENKNFYGWKDYYYSEDSIKKFNEKEQTGV